MPEPEGGMAALADCRGFILSRLDEALGGLDDMGRPDPARRTTVAVHLALRDQVDAPLVTFYVRMGQALHALQDSYAHSYRPPDGTGVTAVMNWVDQVNGDFDEARDGPPHTTELDRCDDPDELRQSRRLMAATSTTEVLRIALDPARTRAQKMAALTALVDAQIGYISGLQLPRITGATLPSARSRETASRAAPWPRPLRRPGPWPGRWSSSRWRRAAVAASRSDSSSPSCCSAPDAHTPSRPNPRPAHRRRRPRT